jgi:hypothetical protein
MSMGRDAPGTFNMVLYEDEEVKTKDFKVIVRCESCFTEHEGTGFIRDNVFRGIYEYHTTTPADDKT